MKYPALMAVLLSSPVIADDLAAPPGIEKVFNNFFHGIEQRDSQLFLSTFTQTPVSWAGVYSKETITRMREHFGSDVNKPKTTSSTPAEFIDFIVNAEFDVKETTSDVNVISDGEVASVSFSYEYFLGDFKMNWGQESWLMVRTDDGWKISAVNFSMTFSTEPFPEPPEK